MQFSSNGRCHWNVICNIENFHFCQIHVSAINSENFANPSASDTLAHISCLFPQRKPNGLWYKIDFKISVLPFQAQLSPIFKWIHVWILYINWLKSTDVLDCIELNFSLSLLYLRNHTNSPISFVGLQHHAKDTFPPLKSNIYCGMIVNEIFLLSFYFATCWEKDISISIPKYIHIQRFL